MDELKKNSDDIMNELKGKIQENKAIQAENNLLNDKLNKIERRKKEVEIPNLYG